MVWERSRLDQTNMRYFHKELVQTPLYLPQGRKFPFDKLSDGNGIWATEDASLIAEAEKAIARHVGGISEITQEQYDALTKKKTGERSANSFQALAQPSFSNNPFGRGHQFAPPAERVAAAASGVAEVKDTAEVPPPLKVPEPHEFKKAATRPARVMKASAIKAATPNEP